MPDREKVINGLECCCSHIVGMSCGNCPYEIEQGEEDGISDCTTVLAYDALALLKEPESVHPEPSCEMTYLTECCCDLCGVQLIKYDNFCCGCGRPIAWEGR